MPLTPLQIEEQISALINNCISEHGNSLKYAAIIREYCAELVAKDGPAGIGITPDTPPIHRPPTNPPPKSGS